MKKLVMFLSFILVLGAGTMFAFAETSLDNDELNWFRDRMEYRRNDLKDALDEGYITEKEYNTWSEHFNYMEEFHEENGFPHGRGFGGCHGGRSYNRRGMNW